MRLGGTHFKAAVFALLGANLVLFQLFGRATELLDTAAWLVLLVLFEVETAGRARLGGWSRPALRALRLIAGAAVVAAAIGYVLESEWLDAANAWLWVAVVILLEIEVRLPAAVGRRRESFLAAAVMLYSALLLLVPLWAWRGEWLDAWDAALWLAAFLAIELNVLARQTGYPEAS